MTPRIWMSVSRLIGAMLIAVPALGAQDLGGARTVTLSLAAGPSFGTLNQLASNVAGQHGQVALTIAPTGWPVQLRGEFGIEHYSMDVTATCPELSEVALYADVARCGTFTGRDNVLSGTMNVVAPSQWRRLTAYAIVGVGTYGLNERLVQTVIPPCARNALPCISEAHYDTNWSRFGYNAGGGMSVKLGAFSVFGEARWHHVPAPNRDVTLVPITVGVAR